MCLLWEEFQNQQRSDQTCGSGETKKLFWWTENFKNQISISHCLFLFKAHPIALSESRSQFNCSACDRSFPLLSSLLNHQHSHTPEQRLLAEAEAEAEIVCPSLSLPLPSLKRDGEREIHVSLIAVTEEGERQTVKPSAKASGKGARRGGGSKTSATNNGKSAAVDANWFSLVYVQHLASLIVRFHYSY